MYPPPRRRSAVLWIAAACFFCAYMPVYGGSLETIQTRIAQCLRRPGIRSTKWGIDVVDANNRTLLEVNPDKPFLPASVLKVLTTSAAIEKLGPDFRFRSWHLRPCPQCSLGASAGFSFGDSAGFDLPIPGDAHFSIRSNGPTGSCHPGRAQI